ncbi:MAG: Gx transporter family protein [Clostridia bacterium]|nr:Gx transporter family protein [Clostridia bacterium]MBQ1942462.1 Gx transporter family protein [Clostridia bacterium]
MKNALSAKKAAFLGLLTAAAMLAFMVENLFPPLIPAVPYIRIGLSNYFVLFAMALYGKKEGFLVLTARLFLGALVTGRTASLLVGIAGAYSSYFIMALFFSLKTPFSLAAIGASGAVLGNLFRIATAALLLGSPQLFSFAAYGVFIGLVSGALIGVAVQLTLRVLPQNFLAKLQNL